MSTWFAYHSSLANSVAMSNEFTASANYGASIMLSGVAETIAKINVNSKANCIANLQIFIILLFRGTFLSSGNKFLNDHLFE